MAVKYLEFILTSFKMNLKTAMEYRLSFLGQALGMVINDVFWLIFWYIFFTKIKDVKGWEFNDVILLFAMTAFSFGLSFGLFANSSNISTLIEEGGLDFYLVLPKDPLLNILLGRFSMSAIGDLLFGLIILFMVEGFRIEALSKFILAGTFAGLILCSFSVTVHSLTFFIKRGTGFAKLMVEAIVCFSTYPITLFEGMAKIALFTLLPAAFISAVPVSIVKDFTWEKVFIMAGVTLAAIIISRFVFYTGLRRYTSGNLITARL